MIDNSLIQGWGEDPVQLLIAQGTIRNCVLMNIDLSAVIRTVQFEDCVLIHCRLDEKGSYEGMAGVLIDSDAKAVVGEAPRRYGMIEWWSERSARGVAEETKDQDENRTLKRSGSWYKRLLREFPVARLGMRKYVLSEVRETLNRVEIEMRVVASSQKSLPRATPLESML